MDTLEFDIYLVVRMNRCLRCDAPNLAHNLAFRFLRAGRRDKMEAVLRKSDPTTAAVDERDDDESRLVQRPILPGGGPGRVIREFDGHSVARSIANNGRDEM
jgi:hypothetical protein